MKRFYQLDSKIYKRELKKVKDFKDDAEIIK